MRPITFQLSRTIPKPATEICSEIADVARCAVPQPNKARLRWECWTALGTEFQGYGLLPGVASAEYEVRTDDMVGSHVRVRSTDGSEHVEEICQWEEGQRIVMKLHAAVEPPRHPLCRGMVF
jgi:hypothetical protein